MKHFFNLFRMWSSARPNQFIVDFLVKHPLFRRLALTFHSRKSSMWTKIDEKLEEIAFDPDTLKKFKEQRQDEEADRIARRKEAKIKKF